MFSLVTMPRQISLYVCVYIYCMNGLALESVCIMHRCPVIQGTFDAICHLVTISEGDNRVSDPRLGNPTLRNSLCLRVFIATTLCGAFWNPASFVPTLDIAAGAFFPSKRRSLIFWDMSKSMDIHGYEFDVLLKESREGHRTHPHPVPSLARCRVKA